MRVLTEYRSACIARFKNFPDASLRIRLIGPVKLFNSD